MTTEHNAGPWNTLQLAILAVVILAPMWIFAQELDGDEFAKSAIGIGAAGIVAVGLRAFDSRWRTK